MVPSSHSPWPWAPWSDQQTSRSEPTLLQRRPDQGEPPTSGNKTTNWEKSFRPSVLRTLNTCHRDWSQRTEPREATRHGRYERDIVSARRDRGTSTEGSRQGQAQPQAPESIAHSSAHSGLLPARLRWLRSPYTRATFTAPSRSAHAPCGRNRSNCFPSVTPRVQCPPSSVQMNHRADDHCAFTVCVCVCVSTHTRGMRWILNLHIRHHLPA